MFKAVSDLKRTYCPL